MKIAITGVGGLIGSWIAQALFEKGHVVVGIDNMFGCYQSTIDELIWKSELCEDLFSKEDLFQFWNVDVTDHKNIPFLSKLVEDCDVVYHCAAIAPEGYSVFSPSIISDSVFMGSTVMATVAVNAKVKRFINCSSMSRYGDLPSPFTEDMETKPVDPYALAKVAAEEQISLLGKLHGMEVVHAIPHNVIGPRQKYNDPYRNVISIMTNLMLQGRQPIIYGDGSQTRCFSMIQDDVKIFLKLLDAEVEHGECFNIGPDDREISILDVAKVIAKTLDFDLDPDFQPPRPYEVPHAICSSDKIRERFGYEPEMTLEDGIESIVNYIKDRGPKAFDYHIPLEIDNEMTPETWKKRKF